MASWKELTELFSDSQQIEEMTKKYGNTYLFVRNSETNKETLVNYQGWDGTFHLFSDSNGGVIKLKHNTFMEVKCKFPHKGLFNHKSRMLYCQNLPNRQYKRGICKDNLQLFDVMSMLRYSHITQNELSSEKLESVFKREYPSCSFAIEKLQQMQAVGIAISRDIGFTLPAVQNSKNLHVFYHNCLIGWTDGKKLHVENSIFTQEIVENEELLKPLEIVLYAQ